MEENNKQHIVWHDDVIVKQFISYAVGCMMGRYSIDKPGLILAIASCRSLSLAYNTPCRMRYGQAHVAVGQVEDCQALVWH